MGEHANDQNQIWLATKWYYAGIMHVFVFMAGPDYYGPIPRHTINAFATGNPFWGQNYLKLV